MIWVKDHAKTWVGDADLDGEFNSGDFVVVFTAGKYEDGIPNNATFEEGDWDGDGDFTTADFVYALAAGTYTTEARPILQTDAAQDHSLFAAVAEDQQQAQQAGASEKSEALDAVFAELGV